MLRHPLLATACASILLSGLYLTFKGQMFAPVTSLQQDAVEGLRVTPPRHAGYCGAKSPALPTTLSTRQQQYARFWRDNPDFPIPSVEQNEMYHFQNKTIDLLGFDPGADVENVTYAVEVSEEREGLLVLLIHESYKGAPSEGGSSFHVLATGETVQYMCEYEDLFNGTYRVYCAMYCGARCVRVSVTLLHVHFRQFHRVVKRQDLPLFSRRLCLHRACCLIHGPAEAWQRDNAIAPWYWQAHGKNYPVGVHEFCSQVDRMIRDRFYMIGASHMRFQYFYIIHTCWQSVYDLRRRLFYIPVRYIDDLEDAIRHFIRKPKRKCPLPVSDQRYSCTPYSPTGIEVITTSMNDTHYQPPDYSMWHDNTKICSHNDSLQTGLLLQTGSWDLSYKGLKYSLDTVIPLVDIAVGKLSAFQKRHPSVKLAAMSPPPHLSARYAITRNNDGVQLFDDAFRGAVEKHGVAYVPTFHVLYPVFRRTSPVDLRHFISCHTDKCQHDVVGVVALQLAVAAMTDHCE